MIHDVIPHEWIQGFSNTDKLRFRNTTPKNSKIAQIQEIIKENLKNVYFFFKHRPNTLLKRYTWVFSQWLLYIANEWKFVWRANNTKDSFLKELLDPTRPKILKEQFPFNYAFESVKTDTFEYQFIWVIRIHCLCEKNFNYLLFLSTTPDIEL